MSESDIKWGSVCKCDELKRELYDLSMKVNNLALSLSGLENIEAESRLIKIEGWMNSHEAYPAPGLEVRRITKEEFKKDYPDVKESQHCCPNCKGVGKNLYFCSTASGGELHLNCVLCEGKGIVWG